MADEQTLTVNAYQQHAAAYRDASTVIPAGLDALLDHFAELLGPDARVLEIGSGGGRDASALEARGVSVRRTDITPAFVELLRGDGHEADVIDPLRDGLTDPARQGSAYDGVWASASLLHVARPDLAVVLTRLAAATRLGAVLHLAVKEGDGEAWSTHGTVPVPRHFTYWRETPLRAALTGAGWVVEGVTVNEGQRGETWLDVFARRG
jgi:SAM-dependent methyltransferase